MACESRRDVAAGCGDVTRKQTRTCCLTASRCVRREARSGAESRRRRRARASTSITSSSSRSSSSRLQCLRIRILLFQMSKTTPKLGFIFGGVGGRHSIACMAEARRAEEGVWFLGRTRRAASPPARGLRERCKLPQWGPGRSPSRNRFWCISKLVEGIKTVFTTKRDTVGSAVFVCLIFP